MGPCPLSFTFLKWSKADITTPLSTLLALLGFLLLSSWSSELHSGFLVSPFYFLEAVWIGSWNKDFSFSCSVILCNRVTKDFHVQSSLPWQRSRRPLLFNPFTARHTRNLPLLFAVGDLPQSLQPSSILPLLINSLWCPRQGVAPLLQIYEFSNKYFQVNWNVSLRYWLSWSNYVQPSPIKTFRFKDSIAISTDVP